MICSEPNEHGMCADRRLNRGYPISKRGSRLGRETTSFGRRWSRQVLPSKDPKEAGRLRVGKSVGRSAVGREEWGQGWCISSCHQGSFHSSNSHSDGGMSDLCASAAVPGKVPSLSLHPPAGAGRACRGWEGNWENGTSTGCELRKPRGPVASQAGLQRMSPACLETCYLLLSGFLVLSFWPELQELDVKIEGVSDRKSQTSCL